jgi:hypothetical protein
MIVIPRSAKPIRGTQAESTVIPAVEAAQTVVAGELANSAWVPRIALWATVG